MTLLRRELRPEARAPSLRFRPPAVRIPLWLLALGWLGLVAWRALRWLVLHPRTTVLAGLLAWSWWTATLYVVVVIVVAGVTVALGWYATDAGSMERWVLEPAGSWWRRWTLYRRHWQPAMLTAGLTLRESWGGDLPTLRSVRSRDGRDVLRVRMLPGQTLEHWKDAAPQLAQTFGATVVRVRRVPNDAQQLELAVLRRTSSNRHVTEPAVEPEPLEPAPRRGAFPRAPRGAA